MPKRVYKRKLRGRGFMKFISKANDFLKKTKAISRIGGLLGSRIPLAGQIGSVARSIGYGRRCGRRRGSGVSLSGRSGGMRRRRK